MRQTLPVKAVDKAPRLQFAVLSIARGAAVAELESSFESSAVATNMFERQYSKWGLTDVNFYLVDWQKQTILQVHEVWQ